jgi:hypothetical protein
VERTIADEASSVSLFIWEESTYIAVDAGNDKKIKPTLRGMPETSKREKNIHPIPGRTTSLRVAARKESPKFPLTPAKVRLPPMDMRASGRATIEIRLRELFTKTGKPFTVLE